MRDENDIVYNDYGIDLFAFIRVFFERLFGGSTGGSTMGGEVAVAGWSFNDVIVWISTIWGFITVLSWIISFILLYGLIYAYIRGNQLSEVVSAILAQQEEAYASLHKKDVKNKRWNDVQEHIKSDQLGDWKLAIIEADIILGELLDKLGYAGNTIGDKLKGVSPSSFHTVNQAWRAHAVRNRIAHEGVDFQLSRTEAQEAITQYKMVFDEFDFV